MHTSVSEYGGLDITCHGQFVLTIDEVSDEDCINLFLTPASSGEIIETDTDPEIDKPWSHELIVIRNNRSRVLFKNNQPKFKID